MKYPANTTLLNFCDCIKVTYYKSTILTYWPHTKELILNTCGYNTTSTKKRMNTFLDILELPGHVSQVKGEWYYSDIQFFNGICEIKL